MAAAAEGQPDEDLSTKIAVFVEQWSLQQDAQQVLIGLEPDVAYKVMAEFSPRDTSRDANNIFLKFTQGVLERERLANNSQLIGTFVRRWNLNEDAQQHLHDLSPAHQEKVMNEFNPRDKSRDVSNIFMKFCQGISWGGGKGGKGFSKGASQGALYGLPAFSATAAMVAQQSAAALPMTAAWQMQAPHLANYAIPVFTERWRLGPIAKQLLESLPAPTAEKVMQEFRPRDTTRDVNGIFLKFAQSVAGQQSSMAAAPMAPMAAAQTVPAVAAQTAHAYGAAQAYGMHTGVPAGVVSGVDAHLAGVAAAADQQYMAAWLDRWSLGADARQIFFGLSPELRLKVMAEFAPRDATIDVNNIFMKFCQGVGSGKGKSKGRVKAAPGSSGVDGRLSLFEPY
eukprot:TRINITY_DN17547_c5_g1_i1.p1 TRINITY_DN17547_c5_g1~~TRINITY_DN17547_c5_g1_i1.p1  ORF type:complete len:429 (+),score=87.31 TRINITY_DN17547_c5_g1_i1:102-1289(+)